jgi:PAS domain S-box-containing protein
MTIIEKPRTEYKLLEQAIDELTRVVQKIETLEADAEELRKSEMMYRKVIEQLPERLYIVDDNLHYVFCNETYAQDLNIKPEEIRGKSAFDFFIGKIAEKIFWHDKEILCSGVLRETEEKYSVSGQEFTVRATRIPVRNDIGDIIGLQVVLRDITEDKRRDERYAELKNLEEVFVQEKTKSNTLSMDLERMTAQRNQLQAEIEDMQESMKKQMALRDADEEKLREELEREKAERKEAVERLQNSFRQIQDLMNSVKPLMERSDSEDQ